MPRKKYPKKLRTFHEVVKSIRHPIAPPGRCHGDARKEKSRKGCRGKQRECDE
jgi:hypothetical protein